MYSLYVRARVRVCACVCERLCLCVCRALGLDVGQFYLKRNATADTPQLKNDQETLRELGIVSGSILHVALGVPLAADEYLLKVCVRVSVFVSVSACVCLCVSG